MPITISQEQAADRVWLEGTEGWSLVPRVWAMDTKERDVILRKTRGGKFVGISELLSAGGKTVEVPHAQ